VAVYKDSGLVLSARRWLYTRILAARVCELPFGLLHASVAGHKGFRPFRFPCEVFGLLVVPFTCTCGFNFEKSLEGVEFALESGKLLCH
jgi:hypothetical protein